MNEYGFGLESSSNARNEAAVDFERARNKATMQSLVGWLTGKNYNLVDYGKVRSRLASTINQLPVQKEIPIKAIIGSVSRGSDFSRTFLPRFDSDKSRWTNVKIANDSADGVPPIDVYQIGDVYFVLDGHHRISVMKQLGAEYILANVQVINTTVPLEPDDSPDEIIVKIERQSFLEKTHADQILPTVNLELKMPGQYPRLLEHIAVNRYYLGIERNHEISNEEGLCHWNETIYQPVVQVIEKKSLLDDFPDETETSLYLWIQENMAELVKEYGENIRVETVAWSLERTFSKSTIWVIKRIYRHIKERFSPDIKDWGVRTGEWRITHNWNDSSRLLRRIMITLSNPMEDMDYLRSVLKMAHRMDAWVGIVHVLRSDEKMNEASIREIQECIEKMLHEENVHGEIYFLEGNLIKNLSDRAFWSDLTVMRMKYRPPAYNLFQTRSGWVKIIHSIPGPILAIPATMNPETNTITLAFDDSPKAREAMYFAGALAKNQPMTIYVVLSGHNASKRNDAEKEIRSYFGKIALDANYWNIDGRPDKAILKKADETNSDVIIMGSYSDKRISSLWHRSTVDKVLAKTNIPVLIGK